MGWVSRLNFYKTDPGAGTRRLHSGPAECERVADVTATTHGWKHKRKITQSVYMSRSQSEQELDDTCERSKNTQCGTHINLHLLHTVYGHTAVTHLHIRQIFRKLSSFCLFTNSKNYGSSPRLLARWCVSASVWCALVV